MSEWYNLWKGVGNFKKVGNRCDKTSESEKGVQISRNHGDKRIDICVCFEFKCSKMKTWDCGCGVWKYNRIEPGIQYKFFLKKDDFIGKC